MIPGECTSAVHSLDVSLNKPFRGHVTHFHAELVAFMEKNQENEEEMLGVPYVKIPRR